MRFMGRFLPRAIMLAALIMVSKAIAPSAAHAAGGITYYVATSGANSSCLAGQSSSTPLLTIGFALSCANGDSTSAASPDTVEIAAGTYYETLAINANVNLVGTSGGTIVDGSGAGTVVAVNPSFSETIFTVNLTALQVQHGLAGGGGGGILNAGGTMALANSTVTSNTGDSDAAGGGIYNTGTLAVTNSTISDNTANNGGGIFNSSGGSLAITDSTISGNTATLFQGGGIASSGTLTLTNSTVSGNTVDQNQGQGGGINNYEGSATLINSTVSGNTVVQGLGGGVYTYTGNLALTDSTVSGNGADQGQGGGIYFHGNVISPYAEGIFSLTDSTVSGNHADEGSGIYNTGNTGQPYDELNLTDSTVAGNFANSGAGYGIYNQWGTENVRASIVATECRSELLRPCSYRSAATTWRTQRQVAVPSPRPRTTSLARIRNWIRWPTTVDQLKRWRWPPPARPWTPSQRRPASARPRISEAMPDPVTAEAPATSARTSSRTLQPPSPCGPRRTPRWPVSR